MQLSSILPINIFLLLTHMYHLVGFSWTFYFNSLYGSHGVQDKSLDEMLYIFFGGNSMIIQQWGFDMCCFSILWYFVSNTLYGHKRKHKQRWVPCTTIDSMDKRFDWGIIMSFHGNLKDFKQSILYLYLSLGPCRYVSWWYSSIPKNT